MKYTLLLGLFISLFNCRNTSGISSSVDPSIWLSSYFDSINRIEAAKFETPKILRVDGYKIVNDKVVTVIVNEDDQLVCTKKYLWVFVDKKVVTSYVEIFRGCDRDYSQISYGYREFVTKDSITFKVIEYSIDAEPKYLDAKGNYKDGVDYSNFDYPTDSATYIIQVRKDGSVENELKGQR